MNLIFKAIVGSQSYGTATPESDVDYKGIYMQSIDDLITFNYKEQVEVGKDECYYEVRRFLQLLQSANPTVLELLYSPEDCIIQTSPQFELIKANRDKFLTTKCLNSFGGYALAQIKKAKGLDKKINWEAKRVERKTPLDFVFAYEDGKTMPITKYLKQGGLEQKYCGLVRLNHFRDCYALYYDYKAKYQDSGNHSETAAGFRGLVLEDSNEMRLSSIPIGLKPETMVFFNKDEYSRHCKDFREYNDWLKKRNTARYTDVKKHGQSIDGKNLLHCRRLLDMANEIATTRTINVRRPNADYLLSIRRGEVPLQEILDKADQDIVGLDEIYAGSSLPNEVDKEFVNDLLLQIRKL